jgi:hypothetical protein
MVETTYRDEKRRINNDDALKNYLVGGSSTVECQLPRLGNGRLGSEDGLRWGAGPVGLFGNRN